MKKDFMRKIKKVTFAEYDKAMGKLIRRYKKKPIHTALIALLEEAAKYEVVPHTEAKRQVGIGK
jgi:hypothetical protein